MSYEARMRLIPKREMLKRVGGVTYPTIWRWMREGSFPRSRAVGERSMWIESEVDAWVADLPMRELKGDASANPQLTMSANSEVEATGKKPAPT